MAPVDAAAARLADSLNGWRRRMARRRVVATGRRWALIAACAAGAGAAAGHLDGRVAATAAYAGSAAVAAGIIRMARARRVPLAAAAREMDAALALDEQVATALWYARTGRAGGNPLTTGLVERAAGLAARAERQARREDPRYGEWLAVAVTTAAAATVVAAPPPAATPASSAAQSRQGPGGGHAAGPANGPLRAASQAPSAAARRRQPGSPPTALSSPTAGLLPPRGGRPSPTTGGASAAPRGSASGNSATGNSAPGNTAPTARAGGQAGRTVPAGAKSGGTHPSTTGPSGANPGRQRMAGAAGPPAGGNAAATTADGSRPGGAQRGAARPGGAPGGATAGITPGDGRRASGLSQFTLPAGGEVALIVVPGADESVTGQPGGERGTEPPAGNGGSAAVTAVSPGGADGAGYVPPDGNEVPFGDHVLLGRYF